MAEKETGEFKYVDDLNYTNSDGTELEGVLGEVRWKQVTVNFSI